LHYFGYGERLSEALVFERLGKGYLLDVFRPIDLSNSFLIAALLTVGLHLRRKVRVSLCLDNGKSVAQALVLDDCCGTDPLIFTEDAVGNQR
jgi:hypothetical protein